MTDPIHQARAALSDARRALIEAQGGHLVARSDGPGTGATFTITLPIVDHWDDPD